MQLKARTTRAGGYTNPGTALTMAASAAKLPYDRADKRLRVTEQHERVVEIVERIVDSGEPRIHAALDHHDRTGLVHVQNRHAVDRTSSVAARGGIGDVVGPDHEGDIRLRKIAIDLLDRKGVV